MKAQRSSFRHTIKHSWIGRNIAPILTVAAFIAAGSTYFTLSSEDMTIGPSPQHVWGLMLVNLALLLTLAAVIFRRVVFLWKQLKRGIAGSRLQRRIVATFSLVAILPALMVSIFSIFFFHLGIQGWFEERVQTAVRESLAVAEAYLEEHKENIRAEALAMSDSLNPVLGMALSNPVEFNRFVSAQASLRSISEVLVFQHNRIIAQGRFTFAAAFESLPQNAIERAAAGEVVLLSGEDDDKVRALVALAQEDTYLLAGRLIDARVLDHLDNTQGAVNQYDELQNNLERLQETFSLVFISLALLMVLGAVWFGMQFAMRLVMPISWLVTAAERVKSGDYDTRVETSGEVDEMTTLARTFNRMTEQLSAQRAQLIDANRSMDERRRFTEAVLGGVSAGVLALAADKRITLANRSAEQILLLRETDVALQGRPVAEVLPGIQELLHQADEKTASVAQGTLTLGSGERGVTLHMRVTAEMHEGHITGYIVTFDDITLLIAAQRHAAWSDVARRVAHEIKNPLTPIALAAERIRRKYGRLVEGEEAETFARYTDTIARHVADIGRMVDEFVSFARMPNPVFREEDMGAIIKKVLFSEQVAHPAIAYRAELPPYPVALLCDERQITQVLTNLLKNSAEALEGRLPEISAPDIEILLSAGEGVITLKVQDNGPGFPPSQIERMMEAYFTTRAKGTGLGLAIAKKIVEDHKGVITLSNRPEGGARVTLSFLQQCDIKAAV